MTIPGDPAVRRNAEERNARDVKNKCRQKCKGQLPPDIAHGKKSSVSLALGSDGDHTRLGVLCFEDGKTFKKTRLGPRPPVDAAGGARRPR